jgi:hypothetical protein
MYKKILLSLLCISALSGVRADTLTLRPDHPSTYTVIKGDTLWDISGRFLDEPWRWNELWQANPQIANPHLIYPGDVLALTYEDGRPLLGLLGNRNVKLSPQVREHVHDEAIAPIPLDAIHQFLSDPRVVGDGVMTTAPYVVSSEDHHLVSGSGNRVYVRGMPPENAATKFSIYRAGLVYRDPDDNDRVLGYEAIHVADALLERTGDPATVRIINAKREVLNGDRLLPHSETEYTQFVPRPPNAEVRGRILSVVDGVSQIGQHQVVALSLGRNDGIEPGHVLGIFEAGRLANDLVAARAKAEAGRAVSAEAPRDPGIAGPKKRGWIEDSFDSVTTDPRDFRRIADQKFGAQIAAQSEPVQLPDERTGELIVFRAFDDVSYGLVMNIVRPAHVRDRVGNP